MFIIALKRCVYLKITQKEKYKILWCFLYLLLLWLNVALIMEEKISG